MTSATLTPAGRIRCGESEPESSRLVKAFSKSNSAGLIELLQCNAEQVKDETLVHWRAFALHLVSQISRDTQAAAVQTATLFDDDGGGDGGGGEGDGGNAVPPGWIVAWVDASPPFRGSEYLTPVVAANIALDLRSTIQSQAGRHDLGLAGWLAALPGQWNLVGRITFHLAENKRDPQRPFAFMATYVNRVSDKARPQHLPLGQALKQYAGEGNQQQLAALLTPVRTAAENSELCRRLLDDRAIFQPQAWTIGQAHQFLIAVPEMKAAGLVVRVPNWWNHRQPPQPQVQVHLGTKMKQRSGESNWLDFSIAMAIDGEPLTEAEQSAILASTEGLMKLRGKWVNVDSQKLQEALTHWKTLQQQHAGGIDFISGMRMLSGVDQGPIDADEQQHSWASVVAGPQLRSLLQQLKDPSSVSSFRPGSGLTATLRPYQADGVRWLHLLRSLRLGGCLADDMGLGKTIQILDLLQQEHAGPPAKNGDPSLLLVPASLLGNWQQETERFAPRLRLRIAHRSEKDAQLLDLLSTVNDRTIDDCDVVVTTYNMVRKLKGIESRKWRMLILDEAQAIKNASSLQSRAIRKLQAETRFVMTGTPIENQIGDLWSLFDFCCPGLLGTSSGFKKTIKRLNERDESAAYRAIRKLVRPYILRRLKTDPGIADELPEKTQLRTDCLLSRKQATLYKKVVQELSQALKSAEGIQRRGLVLGSLMQLKQICNHPAQFLGDPLFAPKESGKFQRLAELCEPIRLRQERLLIFTQFQSITEPLADYLQDVFGRSGLVLHGGTPVKRRKKLVAEFQADDGPPFFVISVKAGGVGLNLTAASHVIHFDRWWNPAVENQATDRAFRIGQKRNVFVHKFVCRGTLEEQIDATLQEKQELSDQILDGDGQTMLTEMSDEQLLEFVSLDFERAVDTG